MAPATLEISFVRADEHPEAAHEQPVVDGPVRFAPPKEEQRVAHAVCRSRHGCREKIAPFNVAAG
jgi:hypothetical protein